MKKILPALLSVTLLSCQQTGDKKVSTDESKAQIKKAENDFETMAAQNGLAEAFSYYAASDAVLHRDSLIRGKDEIRKFYQSKTAKNVSLKWSPDFIDVSASGDMGYTYGKYIFSYTDSTGKTVESKGIFHTVWKKQEDGSWKFVWD